jgi:hypothetical protein
MEIYLEVLEEVGPGYLHCKIVDAKKAVEGRGDLRFKINQGEAVATNFRVSKHTIEVTKFNIPTSIKVVLDQFQSANLKFSDKFVVDVLPSDTKDPVLRTIKNSRKSLFIADASNAETYKAFNNNFLDLTQIYGRELDLLIKKNVEKGLKSVIIVPIIYLTEDERAIPFAYIEALSKDKKFTIDNVLEMKEMSFYLVERIIEANTLFVSANQQIIDIGKGGAKLKIYDSELKKYIPKANGFVFDIVFKLQAPITIYAEIKTTTVDPEGDIFLGIDFEGNSSRQDELKRFYEILKPMIAEYKANIIKSIKNKK